MGKMGNRGTSVFQKTSGKGAPAKKAGSGPGRPRAAEPARPTTVMLRPSQLTFLDGLALKIRTSSGAAIRRAELLRALVDALQSSSIDLTAASSESELVELLSGHLLPAAK